MALFWWMEDDTSQLNKTFEMTNGHIVMMKHSKLDIYLRTGFMVTSHLTNLIDPSHLDRNVSTVTV